MASTRTSTRRRLANAVTDGRSSELRELHSRSSRLYSFSGLEEVEETLNSLAVKEPEPLVIRLPRQPGQKEARIAHLLAGEVSIDHPAERESSKRAPTSKQAEKEALLRLEREVKTLRAEVTGLQQQFEDFKKQFE